MTQLYDITIVGGGPVGLFTAFYAHLRQAKVKIIDSMPQLGDSLPFSILRRLFWIFQPFQACQDRN